MGKKGMYAKTAKRLERQKANREFKKELKRTQCPECQGFYAKYVKSNLGERIICRKCGALIEDRPRHPDPDQPPEKKDTLSWYALLREKLSRK